MRPASIAFAVASLVLLSGWQPANAADPWTSEQYQLGGGANSRQANQYGATIGSGSATQTPSPLDRAQNAVVGTAGTLRDGVEAGIKQANNQLSQAGGQIVSGTTSAGHELGQQLQNVTGFGGQSQPQSATTWPAPPPGLSTAATTAPSNIGSSRPASSSGWTSIRSDMAPPTLLAPPLVPLSMSNSTAGNFSSTAGTGPSFPSSAPPLGNSNAQRDQFHSLLADPSSTSQQIGAASPTTGQSAAKSPDWSSGWGATAPSQATIGRSTSDLSSGPSPSLPRVAPEIPRQTTGNFTTDTDPWNRTATATSTNSSPARSNSTTTPLGDRYSQPSAPSQNGASLWADLPSQSTPLSANAPLGNFNNQPSLNNQPSTSFSNFPNQPSAAQPNMSQPSPNPSAMGQNVAGQPAFAQPGGNMSTLGFGNQNGNQNGMMGQQPASQDQLPWTLLVVSLLFAGSFGGNIYLGWSYADSRYRYYLLARRTTESFHKAVGIAA